MSTNQLHDLVVQIVASRHRRTMERALRHAHTHGSLARADELDSRLGAALRQLRKRRALTAEETKLLADLGFRWSRRDARWLDGYDNLLRFIDEHGHASASARFRAPDGYRLGQWLSKQKSSARRGSLDHVRRELLRQAGVALQEPTISGQ